MKISIYNALLIILLALTGLTSCEEEGYDQIGNPEFYILLPESVPTTAYPNRELSFPVEVYAESGLEKVEIRMDYQSVDGSEVSTFETSKGGEYMFSYTPGLADLGQNLELVIVAYDQKGFTYDITYNVEVVEEPVNINVAFPDGLPDEMEVGDTIDFEIQVTSEDEIAMIETVAGDSVMAFQDGYEDTYIATYSFYYILTPQDGAKDVTFTFRVTDAFDRVYEVDYDLYVIGIRLPEPIDSYSDVTLGMQNNPSDGQFIDLETNSIYTISSGRTNSAVVDLGTFRSGSSGINLFAPIYSNAAQFIYNSSNSGDDWLGNWTVRNETEIRIIAPEVLSESDFNSMTDDELMYDAFNESEPSRENVTLVAVGDILGFKTVDGKIGAILVKSIVDAGDGSITFDYKIQE